MKTKIFSCLTLAAMLLPFAAMAQSVGYQQFMQSVARRNAAYIAEQYKVDIANANLQAARVFNDPELSVTYGNNQDWYKLMGQSLELGLSYDLDLAGVRRTRIRAAKSEKEIAEASVRAYLSSLRAEASQAWAEAWRLRESCRLLEEAVGDMDRIAQSDSIRLAAGDISRADAMQSRLEAQTLRGEWLAQQAEYRNAIIKLSYLAGGDAITSITDKQLPIEGVDYCREGIYAIAEINRADLRAAELSQTLSAANLRMVKAGRSLDMSLSLGYSYNTEVRNEIAPAPKYNGLSVGVTIPLKFSSLNRGELRAARSEVKQSRQNYETARQQVRMEVAQAYNTLQAARQVLRQYDGNMTGDARAILQGRTMGYMKGETSLLELLTARQTYHDIMQAYIQACCDSYLGEVQLKQALGL